MLRKKKLTRDLKIFLTLYTYVVCSPSFTFSLSLCAGAERNRADFFPSFLQALGISASVKVQLLFSPKYRHYHSIFQSLIKNRKYSATVRKELKRIFLTNIRYKNPQYQSTLAIPASKLGHFSYVLIYSDVKLPS